MGSTVAPSGEYKAGAEALSGWLEQGDKRTVYKLAKECTALLGTDQQRQLYSFLRKGHVISNRLGAAILQVTDLEWFQRFQGVPLKKIPSAIEYAKTFDDVNEMMELFESLPEGSPERERIRNAIGNKAALLLIHLVSAQFELPSQMEEFIPLAEMADIARGKAGRRG